MKIDTTKNYKVTKYTKTMDTNIGILPGSDVKALLKNYSYDADYDLWFTKAASTAYSVEEV